MASPYENYDYGEIENQLKQQAQQKGVTYDPSDLEGIKRNASYTDPNGNFTGTDPTKGLQNAFATYDQRATNKPGGGPQYQTPTQAWNNQPSSGGGGGDTSGELYKLLMQRATQGTAVDRLDPTVRQQVDPVVAQQTRASRGYLDSVAEQSGPLANLQGERRLASERSGQAAGALESEVIGRVQTQRAQEIQQALSLWGNQLQSDQRLALQKELAYLMDASRTADRNLNASQFTQSQGQSNDQFLRELALREDDQNNLWDYKWSGAGG